MSAMDLRNSYDAVLTFNVNAPAAGTFTQIAKLLTTAQLAEIQSGPGQNGYITQRMDIFSSVALQFKTGPPGQANAGTLDPNSGPQNINAAQKPNESILCTTPENYVYLSCATGGPSVASLTFYVVKVEGV